MTTALEGGEGSASRRCRSLPSGKTRYPLYRRLGGPQGRSGQLRTVSPPTGIRSPDRPARSQSLYRRRYPAHYQKICIVVKQFCFVVTKHTKFQASAAMEMRSALSWVFTQRVVLIPYRRFGRPVDPIFKGQDSKQRAFFLGFLSLYNGIERKSRNVVKELPTRAA